MEKVKKTLAALVALASLSSAASAENLCKFTKTDWAMLGASNSLMIQDWMQTRNIVERQNVYHEKYNLMLPKHPTYTQVDLYFVGSLALVNGMACYLDDPWRKIFLGSEIAIEYKMTKNNREIGLKTSFHF